MLRKARSGGAGRGFARRVEPYARRLVRVGEPRPTPEGDPAALQANGDTAFARAKLPFLRQRYAFQLLRLRFYRNDWKGVAVLPRQAAKALEGAVGQPEVARPLLPGRRARRTTASCAKANLLLARIHAGSPALAPFRGPRFSADGGGRLEGDAGAGHVERRRGWSCGAWSA